VIETNVYPAPFLNDSVMTRAATESFSGMVLHYVYFFPFYSGLLYIL
jgi:hypothetical protein